jgi:hypothetical protein
VATLSRDGSESEFRYVVTLHGIIPDAVQGLSAAFVQRLATCFDCEADRRIRPLGRCHLTLMTRRKCKPLEPLVLNMRRDQIIVAAAPTASSTSGKIARILSGEAFRVADLTAAALLGVLPRAPRQGRWPVRRAASS